MGLFSVLGTSSAGLKFVQDSLALVAQNVAGAHENGYVRRVQSPISVSSGVDPGAIGRVLDRYVQNGFWQAKTGSAYAKRMSNTLGDINNLFGTPGAESGLPNLLSKFQDSLKVLVSDPKSSAARAQVLGQMNLLVNSIHQISDGIQTTRASVESALSDDTEQLNSYLQQIDGLNRKIGTSESDPGLLDQRDVLIGQVSQLIGISVREQSDGTVHISTDTGSVLVDQSGAAKLSFDARGNIAATDLYDIDPTKRKVGTIVATSPGGTTVDLLANGLVKSGELGGLVTLRDQSLTEAQGQIDDLAASLSQVFSDQTVSGIAITGGQSLDLTGLQAGNRIHISYTDSAGKAYQLAFVGVSNASSLPLPASAALSDGEEVIGIDISGGMSGIASAMQSAITSRGSGVSVAAGTGNSIDVTATSPAALTSLSATITNAFIGSGSKGLPLFTDGNASNNLFTDRYDGGRQRIGFASRIQVNPQIKADPSLLSTWGDTSGANDDLFRVNSLLSRIKTQKIATSFQSQLGLAGGAGTVSDILNQFIQQQSISTNNAATLSSSQSVTLNYLQAKFDSISGVNIDTELANMTGLQAAYAANALVMTAARDMLDVLMRI